MRTNDGLEIASPRERPDEVVRELRESSNAPGDTDAEFMRQVARRVSRQHNRKIRCWPAEDFVEDLIKIGLILVDDGEKK